MKRTRYEKTEAVARQYAKRYRRKCADAAEFVRTTLAEALDTQGIKCALSARAKEAKSLARKLRKVRKAPLPLKHLIPFIGTERDANRVKDLAGARVSLYFPSDWALVEAQIFDCFKNVTVKVHPETVRSRPSRRRFDGYAARHYYIDSRHKLRVELQVASALTHAWMEVEHDLVYKLGRKALDASELATLDGLNGITTAGEALLDGLKVRLLKRGVIKARKGDRLSIAASAIRGSKNEFVVIGQNLFSLLVGEGPEGANRARKFQDGLIRRLMTQKKLRATIVVADPRHNEQTSDLGYGFPLFSRHLRKSIAALKAIRARAVEAGVLGRLTVGTSRSVETISTVLSDPAHAGGVAYVTYTQLGSRTKERAIVKIEKRKHPFHFAGLHEDYVCRCVKTLEPF